MNYFLTTERLGFRHWRAEDLPLAVALWTDPAVMAHMGGAYTPEEAQARLHDEMQRQAEHGIQYWPVFALDTGEFAGCAGLKPYRGGTSVMEIGVHIARPFWSGRYGEEAAMAVIGWAWKSLGAEALMAGHGPENVNSKALIERIGFVYTHDEPWGRQDRMHPWYRMERQKE